MKKEKIDLIEKNIDRIITWITNYDTKASIILSLIFAALAIVFTSDNKEECFTAPENQFISVIYYILLVIIVITVIVSIASMLMVLIPRTNRKHIKTQQSTSDTKSIIYFKEISMLEYHDFCKAWKTIDNDNFGDEELEQLYSLSNVCSKKNYAFKMGSVFLSIACFAFCGLLLISLL